MKAVVRPRLAAIPALPDHFLDPTRIVDPRKR
jgi:hypothetical protein